jgi:hypothetical protein
LFTQWLTSDLEPLRLSVVALRGEYSAEFQKRRQFEADPEVKQLEARLVELRRRLEATDTLAKVSESERWSACSVGYSATGGQTHDRDDPACERVEAKRTLQKETRSRVQQEFDDVSRRLRELRLAGGMYDRHR